ncbi:MAG: hypothetical protein Pg6C_00860 [Treponemataceae bacterium]|nr:MAG: hypothetical protein Pg6C_00860 [Treponemataceae bacterium]
MRVRFFIFACVVFCARMGAFPQTHVSVPVDSRIYFLLENAQIRGLCKPLPGAKPYSRAVVLRALDEILSAEPGAGLTDKERRIFQNERKMYSTPESGWDNKRGGVYYEQRAETSGAKYSIDARVSWQSVFSEAITAQTSDFSWGTDNWLTVELRGDMGDKFSWDFSGAGGLFRVPRINLGEYHTYYDGFQDNGSYIDQKITSFSQPVSYFPYAYKKNWEGSIFYLTALSASGYESWPDEIAAGYNMYYELSGSVFDGRFTYRLGRINREWGAMANGQSLSLNAMARPFLAAEATASPFDWLSFSAMTGVLEYYNAEGIKTSSRTFQNAFSIALAEINYKNFHFDIGSSAVWNKRFELGYLFPLNSNFFYQNNVGDFDNMALNIGMSYNFPGFARFWGSFFADEFDLSTKSNFFKLDRNMYAFQLGASSSFPIGGLSFPSITVSVTKIEPYTYTHTRIFVPWYGTDDNGNPLRMESAYVNNGENLGYYLPPNSAEFLVKFEAMTGENTKTRARYQLVVHGADHGPSAVDGSSLLSELDPDGRNEKDQLKKFFLQDGAYEWQNVFMVGAEHTLRKYSLPIKLFGEIGIVHSFYTDIGGDANSGSKEKFSFVDTAEYPQSTRIICSIGFCVYPQ